MGARFEVIAEVEPATRPDLTRVRHQVGVLAPVADAFLIPDNHLGRATVSSLAVAHEVASMGVSAIACLNSRDRNKLGFQRDLLTAAAYGIDRFLCVFGDRPTSGGRSNDLTVRTMLEEIRTFGTSETFTGHGPFTVGVTSRLAPLPLWKQDAAPPSGCHHRRGAARAGMKRKIGYSWRLREVMATRGMFTATELVPLLHERGIKLSASQVHRLVSGTPERLSLQVLSAFCDILGCTPADVVTTTAENVGVRKTATDDRPAPSTVTKLRPRPARILSDE